MPPSKTTTWSRTAARKSRGDKLPACGPDASRAGMAAMVPNLDMAVSRLGSPGSGKIPVMPTTTDAPLRRTFAQWYCVLAGASLLVAGILGFAADAGFDTGNNVQGDNLIVFEVNGWHNLVHIASGLLLLAAANTRPTAKAVAMAFGI